MFGRGKMMLRIENAECEALARRFAGLLGMPVGEAVVEALREKVAREERRRHSGLGAELLAIRQRCAALPDLDGRSAEHVIGFDEDGIPR
jgi:antitoxin VapB